MSSIDSEKRHMCINTDRIVFTTLPHWCVSDPSRGTTCTWWRVFRCFFGLSSEDATSSCSSRGCVWTCLQQTQDRSICHRTIKYLPAANDLSTWARKQLETWRVKGCKLHYRSLLSYISCSHALLFRRRNCSLKNRFSCIEVEPPICQLLFKNRNRLGFIQHSD